MEDGYTAGWTRLWQHSATGDLGVKGSRLSSSLRGLTGGNVQVGCFLCLKEGPTASACSGSVWGVCRTPQSRVKRRRLWKITTLNPVLFLSLLFKPHPRFVSRQWFFHQSCELITKNQNYRVYGFPVWRGMLDSLHGNLLQLSVGKTHITCIKYNARYFFLLLDPNFIQF